MDDGNIVKKSSAFAAVIFLSLIAYLPFHIFISTVIGVNIGGLDFLKASKDIVIIVILLLLTPYLWKNRKKVLNLLKEKLSILCLIYILLNVVFFIFNHRDLDSAALGLVYNTRFIVVFLLAALLHMAQPKLINVSIISKIIIISGLIVGIFGVIQYLILPEDFFAKLGYSMQNGVLPWFYIDDKPDFLRIMSTMRDPNSLGSYLLIPISLLLAKVLTSYKKMNLKTKALYFSALTVLLLALIFAFSRSAIVGLIFTITIMLLAVFFNYFKNNFKKVLIILVSVSALIFFISFIFYQSNQRAFNNIVFHADEETTLRDPNELRIDFIERSIDQIADNPIGDGVGTAGLASMKNDEIQVNLTENYYLQIAIEIGIIGAALFITICFMVLQKLFNVWVNTKTYQPLALVSSFGGLLVTNMFAHIWTNETIAVIWWGFAAVCIMQYKKSKKNK